MEIFPVSLYFLYLFCGSEIPLLSVDFVAALLPSKK